MTHWKNLVSMMVLSGAAALAGTGCLAQSADDEAADDHAVAPGADQAAGAEKTGDAKEACGWGGGWGGCGGWGGWAGCSGGFLPSSLLDCGICGGW